MPGKQSVPGRAGGVGNALFVRRFLGEVKVWRSGFRSTCVTKVTAPVVLCCAEGMVAGGPSRACGRPGVAVCAAAGPPVVALALTWYFCAVLRCLSTPVRCPSGCPGRPLLCGVGAGVRVVRNLLPGGRIACGVSATAVSECPESPDRCGGVSRSGYGRRPDT
jgi:hypothetical protein